MLNISDFEQIKSLLTREKLAQNQLDYLVSAQPNLDLNSVDWEVYIPRSILKTVITDILNDSLFE